MISSSPVIINKKGTEDGKVWIITLNREYARNSVDKDCAIKLADAFEEFDSNETSCVVILTSVGDTFCAGADLKALSRYDNEESKSSNNLTSIKGDDNVDYVIDKTGPMGITRMLTKKPIIAAIRGYAVAGGLEIACWCDLRVCDSSAVFGVFCRRFGVPLIDGGTYRLVQLIGLSRAMDMILTGRPVNAKEAFQMGIANRYVEDPEDLIPCALKLAQQIADFPQECLRTDRLSVYYGLGRPWRSAMKKEFDKGNPIVEKESVNGAKRFASGVGKHGKFTSNKIELSKELISKL